MPYGNVDTQALAYLTGGTYQREDIAQTGLTWTTGTESEVAEIAASIKTDATSDAMFSWVKAHLLFGVASLAFGNEWFLIRCAAADAIQDMSDAAVVEGLHKEGCILKRGWVARGSSNYQGFAVLEFEVHKVRLPLGEELRLVLLPHITSASSGQYYGVLEYRQVGV